MTRVSEIVIGLGDYIDRGPDSRGVFDILCAGFGKKVRQIYLRGNHEDLLLRFLKKPKSVGRTWLQMGGLFTLRSYGIDVRPYIGANPDLRRLCEEFARVLPRRHLDLLLAMPTSHILGDYFFAHAGARAGVPLTKQREKDLLWLRDGFSDRDDPFEKVVVHGHTPTSAPFVGNHRINLDTAAHSTNRLTCLVLEKSERRVLQVGG